MVYPELPEVEWSGNILSIGLTGGIASGKSVVAETFRKLGAVVVNADTLATIELETPEATAKIREAFGAGVLDESGNVSRQKLAQRVFRNERERKILNGIIHPGVRRRFSEIRDELAAGSLLVYDVPLLFEANLESDFDMTIVISAPLPLRIERAKGRNGWSEQEFMEREKAQIAPGEKEKRATLVIRNEGSREELEKSIKKVFEHLLKKKRTDATSK